MTISGTDRRGAISFDQYLSYFDVAAHLINISVIHHYTADNKASHPKITGNNIHVLPYQLNGGGKGWEIQYV